MKTWIWVIIVFVVIAGVGYWVYGRTTPEAQIPNVETATTTSEAAPETPDQSIQDRDNSDASLQADVSDINGQMDAFSADASDSAASPQ